MVKQDDERPHRSDKYQYLLLEVLLAKHDLWATFEQPHNKSFPISMEKADYLRDLDEQLKDELWVMLKSNLTARQLEVLTLYVEGNTQSEIAKMLNVNQSSVTKSLNGNTDYKNGTGTTVTYGGIQKKVANLIVRCQSIKPIMKEIHDIWEPESIRLPFYQTFRKMLGNETQFEAWLISVPPANLKLTSPALPPDGRARPQLSASQIMILIQKARAGATVERLCKEFRINKMKVNKILGVK